MLLPWINRLVPTILAIVIMLVICTVGIPTRSISFAITAPQRVLVPHVDVKITAFTPASFSSLAIFLPIFLALSKVVTTPVVEK